MRPTKAVLLLASLFLFSAGAHADPLTEDSCSVIATNTGEKPMVRDVPGLSVLNLDPNEPFPVFATDGVKLNGVMCWRSEARFSRNDYVVAAAGLSLYVKTDYEDESLNRSVVLENASGSFRIRLLSGPAWTAAEKEEMSQLVRFFNSTLKEKPDSAEEPI